MAIASCNVKIVSRASGRSSVAAAAYRAGERLYNEKEGITYDYSRKRGIVHTEILTPANVPEWAKDREKLWNAVEAAEKQKNAQTAREVEIALPKELTREQNIALARDYAHSFVKQGMIADLCIHDKGDGNPHAHIMLTMRPLSQDGEWLAKCHKEYILDSRGEKIRLKSGAYKSRRVNTVDWDNPEKVSTWRETYQDITNSHLEKAGRSERINVHSYEDQGIDQIPTIHLGVAAHHMEQRGLSTERGDINREIEEINREREAIRKEMSSIQEQRQKEEAHMKSEEHKPRTITEAELEKMLRGWVEEARQELQKEAKSKDATKEQHMEEKTQTDVLKTIQERSAQLEAERQAALRQEITSAYQEMKAKLEALRNFMDEWNMNEQRLDRFQAVEVKRELTEKEHGDYQRTLDHAEALWKIVEKAFPEYRANGQPYIDPKEMHEDFLSYLKAANSMKSFLEGTTKHQQLQERLEELGVDISMKHIQETQQAWAQLNELRESRRAIEQNRVVTPSIYPDVEQMLEEAERQKMEQQQQEAQQEPQPKAVHEPNIWDVIQERLTKLDAEHQAALTSDVPPERRLGQPRELSLEDQTRLLIEAGNTSIAKFSLDDAARKQAMKDLQQTLIEKARQLERQTPLKDTLGALQEQTPLHDTLRAIHQPEMPAAQHSFSWDTLSERLSQLQAGERLAARNEAAAQEQRNQAMERLQERFDEQLKQHYEPAPSKPPQPEIWKAIQERSAELEAQQKSEKQQHPPQPNVWDSLSERMAQLRAEQMAEKQADPQQEKQRNQAMERLQERFDEQVKQTYEPVEPSHYIGAEAYEKRIAKPEAWRAERKAAERQRAEQPEPSKPQESPIWKSLQERSAALNEMEQKMAARQQQEEAHRQEAIRQEQAQQLELAQIHEAVKKQVEEIRKQQERAKQQEEARRQETIRPEQQSSPAPPKYNMDAIAKLLSQRSQAHSADAFQEQSTRSEEALRTERAADFEQDWKKKVRQHRQDHRHHERERHHERQHDFGRDQ